MRSRIASLLASVAVLCAFAGTAAADSADVCQQAETQGCWTAPFSPMGMFDDRPPRTPEESLAYPAAASIVMMPSGRMIYWNGLQNLEDCNDAGLALDAGRCAANARSMMLDLGGDVPLFLEVETNDGDDLFCADQRLLQDSRLMAAGGTAWRSDVDLTPVTGSAGPGGVAELYGSSQTHFFSEDGKGGQWAPVDPAESMRYGRWYPTLVTLADGDMLVAGGVSKLLYNDKGLNVNQVEVFDRQTGRWADQGPSAESTLPLFARLHLLPNGHVFFGGVGQMWGPAGATLDEALWNLQKVYDPTKKQWYVTGVPLYGARSGAFSAMLPLKPPYDKVQLLVGGGVLGSSPGSYLATPLSELVTVADANNDGQVESSSVRTSEMRNRRWYSSAVVLPNGQVLAANGADKDEVIAPGIESAVRQLELWDGSQWVALEKPGARDRTYHNSMILLPDGSVLIGGHAPINRLYGGKGGGPIGPFANNLKDPSFERYYPPYLFGHRPEIDKARAGAAWGQTLSFTMDEGGAPVSKVVLSRAPSATHITDADARTIELEFHASGTAVQARIPDNRAVVPPGYYYLFAVGADGTPSVAPIVKIAAADELPPGLVEPVRLGEQSLRP